MPDTPHTLPRAAWLITGLVVLSGFALLGLWRRPGGGAGTGAEAETAIAAWRRFAASVQAIGAVKPQIGAEVRVGSRISGRVERLRANIGDRVVRGAVIAELEADDQDAAVAQRQAERQLAQARYEALDALQPRELEVARAEVARWEATLLQTRQERERQEVLYSRGVTTVADLEGARERHLVAESQLHSASSALAHLEALHLEQRKQLAVEVARAEATLASALVNRSFTVLRAPISGIIGSVSTQEGETVAAGLNAPTFVTIIDLERLQVDAYVDEVDIGKIVVGQEVTFTVDAFPAEDFEGSVAAIYPSATIMDNVVKYVVAVNVTGPHQGRLRPEMTAAVRIFLESREVLALPARAIKRDEGRNVVYVVDGRRIQMRPVRVGWRDGPWAEIVEGLAEGERVLLEAPISGGG